MKKIVSTTLIAIALAMVSTVDAKRVSKSAAAANLVEAAKNAEEANTPATKKELEATINEEANTPAKEETVDLKVRENKLLEGKKIVEERIKELRGWFGGLFAGKDTRKALSAANDRLSDINDELKKIRADLKENTKETGSAWASAVDYAIKTAKYLGIPVIVVGGVAYDLYAKKGYTQEMLRRGGEMYTTGKEYLSKRFGRTTAMPQETISEEKSMKPETPRARRLRLEKAAEAKVLSTRK